MKYLYFLLLIVAFSISSYAFAQDTLKINSYRFTSNVGMTYSNTFGNGSVSESWIHGIPEWSTHAAAGDAFIVGKKFGVGITKDLSSTFSLGFDLNYIEKGSKVPVAWIDYKDPNQMWGFTESTIENINEEVRFRLKYLELPFHIETRYKMFYLKSGVYAGILLDAKEYGSITEVDYVRDRERSYSRFDGGILMGLGTRIPITDKAIIKIGFSGSWNVFGNDRRDIIPRSSNHWYNQTYTFELKFEHIL